ncbi:hypothetical protein JNUCC1_00246 [Lentibacillus sp. JNUCC-1]|nr:hypothetical protein [Lentibacillus sp. JNUCC-1]
MDNNPVIHGRVSDHKLCGDFQHGYHVSCHQMFTIWALGWHRLRPKFPKSTPDTQPAFNMSMKCLSNSKKVRAFWRYFNYIEGGSTKTALCGQRRHTPCRGKEAKAVPAARRHCESVLLEQMSHLSCDKVKATSRSGNHDTLTNIYGSIWIYRKF